MSGTNGVEAPNGEAAPEALPDDAIDGALAEAEAQHVDTQGRKNEVEISELKSHLQAQGDMIREMSGTIKSLKEQNEELVGGMRDAKDRGYDYEVQRLRGIMHKAMDEGDKETFKAAEYDLNALRSQGGPTGQRVKQDKTPPTGDPPPQKLDPAADRWMRQPDNSWFHSDEELHAAMVAAEASMLRKYPDISTRLQKAREHIVKTFPHKFPNQARNNPPPPSRPGPQAAARAKPKAKTEADLPAEARAIMERQVSKGILTKDQYLKDFPWDN